MISLPPSMLQAQAANEQSPVVQSGSTSPPSAPDDGNLLMAAADMHREGRLVPPRSYNHAAHVRYHGRR